MKKTQEEKKRYFKGLRENWKQAKEIYLKDKNAIEAIIKSHGLKISGISFTMVKAQMRKEGFEGLPYLDCKTFKGWNESGFIVKKGQKSKIDGITWIDISKEKEEDEILIPKCYKLFHKSQVKPL